MWAVLGTTKIAESIVAAIREAGDEVISVYTHSNQERLGSFAERLQINNKFMNIDQALGVGGVRAVWIGTPNQAHAEACLKAFANDRIAIVLSEKSLERKLALALDIEEGLKSAILSRTQRGVQNPLIFREAIFYLNHPIIHKFHTFLKTGALGEIKHINAEYSRDLSRFTNPDGGGAIYNLGIYPVSLVRLALGTVYGDKADMFRKRNIRAIAYIQNDKNCREEKNQNYIARSTAIINFANDVKATITACEIHESEKSNEFEMVGTKGRLIFLTNPYLPNKGLNQFDFIDAQGKTQSFRANGEYDAYTYQILMTKYDWLMQRELAARPSATLSDSMLMMEFLTDWEDTAVENAESKIGSLDTLKATLSRAIL